MWVTNDPAHLVDLERVTRGQHVAAPDAQKDTDWRAAANEFVRPSATAAAPPPRTSTPAGPWTAWC
jgi:hypothetical protein